MEQFIANGLCKGSIYVVVALGFGLIYTTSRVFHIAHGLLYTLGAYGLIVGTGWLGLPIWCAIGFSVVATALVGVGIERLVYWPLERKRASGPVLMIASFGVYIVGVNLIAMLFGNESKAISNGAASTIRFGDVILTYIQLCQFATGALVVIAFASFLKWSSSGRVCRAIADDPILAEVLGVRVGIARAFVFGLGSLLAAVGGILSALDVGMDPYVGLPAVLVAAVACIIGGLRRFLAPAMGGVLLALIQSLIVWQTSAHWESAVTFALLIGFLVWRPQGLVGQAVRLEEAR